MLLAGAADYSPELTLYRALWVHCRWPGLAVVFELLEADSVSTFIILLSIAVGLAVGTALVLLVQLQRRSEVINSMPSFSNAVGQWGVVEVPFSSTSRGKVRLTLKGSTMDLLATTDSERQLTVGERVFVVAAQGNSVLVVPEDQMQS